MGLPYLGFLLPSEKHILAPHTCSKGREVKDVGVREDWSGIERAAENKMRKQVSHLLEALKGHIENLYLMKAISHSSKQNVCPYLEKNFKKS